MTASNDRRHRLQMHPPRVLDDAIESIIYRETDKQILRDLFIGDMTYEAAAEKYAYSRSGMLKHVKPLTQRVEKYLKNEYVQ